MAESLCRGPPNTEFEDASFVEFYRSVQYSEPGTDSRGFQSLLVQNSEASFLYGQRYLGHLSVPVHRVRSILEYSGVPHGASCLAPEMNELHCLSTFVVLPIWTLRVESNLPAQL